jgi:hypothetical protein
MTMNDINIGEKERDELKKLESESLKQIVLDANEGNSKKSEEKLENSSISLS